MHGETGMTIWKLVIGVVVGVFLLFLVAAILIPNSGSAIELPNRTVCMSNLRSIGNALKLYRSENDGAWPWIGEVTSDPTVVRTGTNRNRSPLKDPNAPCDRSITSLMFLLVRMDQPPGMFRCPSDKNSVVDDNTKAKQDDGDKDSGVRERQYYWDFSKPENLSYSWQAPVWKDGRFLQGILKGTYEEDTETAIAADMTPRYGGFEKWTPRAIDGQSTQADIEKQLSNNHKGKQVNILRVAGNVAAVKRPDVGIYRDSIYTASGNLNGGSQGATSLDIRKHLSSRDTFLIGPVGRAEAE
jgi:hypothetical protein